MNKQQQSAAEPFDLGYELDQAKIAEAAQYADMTQAKAALADAEANYGAARDRFRRAVAAVRDAQLAPFRQAGSRDQ